MTKKKLILHDLTREEAQTVLPPESDDITLFSALPAVHHCVECFGCWVKTPGTCLIKDRASAFPALMATHEQLIIVSRMVFGGLSPEIKAVVDRSIGFILPYFRIVEGEMHHQQRYETAPALFYLFYGLDISQQEVEIASKLVKANGLNFSAPSAEVAFFASPLELEEVFA